MKNKSYSGPDAPLVRIYEQKFKDGKSALTYREKACKGSKQDKLTIVKEKKLLMQLHKLKYGASFKQTQVRRCLKKAAAKVKDSWNPKLLEQHEQSWVEAVTKRLLRIARDWSQNLRKQKFRNGSARHLARA